MWRTSAMALSLCAISVAAQAADIEFAFTEDTLEGRYITDGGLIGVENTDLAAGLLLTDDRDIVGSGSLMVPGVLGNLTPGPLSIAVGGKTVLALLDDPDDEVVGIAPGAEARFNLRLGTPMAVVGNIFYSPDIVTFGDAENVLDINLRYEIQFVERVGGFVGFRWLSFDRDEGEDDIVENLQAGVRVSF